MKLSIVVPVYNSEKYLEKCLTSIQNQDLTDWECILIDDGSTDRSGAICDYFSVKDNRFKVIHKYNEGPGQARNLGIFLSKGDWLGFVDSDDWIDSNRFSFVINYAEKNNLDYVQCSFKIWKDNQHQSNWVYEPGIYSIQDKVQLSDAKHDIGHAPNKLYRTRIIKENNIKFEHCKLAEDLFFNVRYYLVVGKLAVLDWSGYNYRRDSTETLSRKYLSTCERLNMIRTFEKFNYEMESNPNWQFMKSNFREFFDNCLIRHSDPGTVDYVFPYVDSSDINWQTLYNKTKYGDNPDAVGSFRFSGDEHNLLKYVFRGIEKYMPWIGIIHFVIWDHSQVPTWLDTSKVHIVTHKDFIPQEFLPTFNSSTIELFIPHIVGLAEKYINANDDFYPIERSKARMFFEDLENYKAAPKFKYSINETKPEHRGTLWFSFFKNSFDLAAELLSKKPLCDENHWVAPPHIAIGYRKSICKEAWKQGYNKIINTITTFREEKNISEYFYFWYTVLSGRYKHDMYHYSYEPIARANPRRIAKIITQESTANLAHPVRFICINDTADIEKDWSSIQESFAKILPNRSIFEKE